MHSHIRHLTCALAAGACCALSAAPAEGQLRIQATSIASGDVLAYYGLGDLGGGVGHGTYQLGACAFNGVDRTDCTTTGSYVETAASVHPGATGTFTWRMTWMGNGSNPIQASSVAPGSNNLALYSVPAGSFFEVLLGSGLYANLDFGVPDTPNPTDGTLNWQAFASPNAVCTGGPSSCAIGAVGLSNGSSFTSPIAAFDMQLDYPGSVLPTTTPEPTAIVLLAVGLGLVGVGGARRRAAGA